MKKVTKEKMERSLEGKYCLIFKNGNYYILNGDVAFCKLNTHGNIFKTIEDARIMVASDIMLEALRGIAAALSQNATFPADLEYCKNTANFAISRATIK